MFMFFFFKQKTAYEVRISDWSSDVCSSDLLADDRGAFAEARQRIGVALHLEQLGGHLLAVERLGHRIGGVLDRRLVGRALLGVGGCGAGKPACRESE